MTRRPLLALVGAMLLPIGVTPRFIPAGGALCDRPKLSHLAERHTGCIDRSPKGARPEDLPVGLPAESDLVINRKALQAIGFAIPQALLLRAGEVIR